MREGGTIVLNERGRDHYFFMREGGTIVLNAVISRHTDSGQIYRQLFGSPISFIKLTVPKEDLLERMSFTGTWLCLPTMTVFRHVALPKLLSTCGVTKAVNYNTVL